MPIWVPDEVHEAVRDLVRAREAAARDLRHKRQQVLSFSSSSRAHLHGPSTLEPGAPALARRAGLQPPGPADRFSGPSGCRRRTSPISATKVTATRKETPRMA